MTDTVTVERIDILEGPNLEKLLRSFQVAAEFEDRSVFKPVEVQARFDLVRIYDESETDLSKDLGTMFRGVLLGIRYLGKDRRNKHDFVITLESALGTFEGHYNVRTRKGSIERLK